MNPLRGDGNLTPEERANLLRVRRYAVPRWMIERATGRRLAGDWRGALAAARVRVAFDPAEVAGAYGAAVAGALTADLHHLVPDLVRWHLPRVMGGRSTIATGRTVVLAGYGDGPGAGLPRSPYLYVVTPAMQDGPQRLVLCFGPVAGSTPSGTLPASADDWRPLRHLWDARCTAGLRAAATGGAAGRIPFLDDAGAPYSHRDPGAPTDDAAARSERVTLLFQDTGTAEAFAEAGVEWDPEPPVTKRRWQSVDPGSVIRHLAPDIPRLEWSVRRWTAVTGTDRFRIGAHWSAHVLLELTDHANGGRLRVRTVAKEAAEGLPCLPGPAWQPLPDLRLLRAGALPARWLHPLVAGALFPRLEGPFGAPGPTPPAPVRVRCRGEWHEVVLRDGVLRSPHSEEERQREAAMRAFGGAVAGCFAAEHALTSGTGRPPKALRAQRRELFLRAQHGDTPGVLEMLDTGMDVRVRGGGRRGLLHLLPLLDHEVLLPRLLAAGLDLEARDHRHRTPLAAAVGEGGSPALVRALLGAGARIDVVDQSDHSLDQLIRAYRRSDLGFLRERVEREHPGIGADWFEEWHDADDDEGHGTQ
ncbi:ankyrin repeat domain-containing protein [Streptomyces nitrosporeus]|uniref:Ankyrin repeat domain-containing protein n=1 Tax=Streptomyces nitrosporeus TaxID=28894 RepID=A0A5J6F6U5_9ACTN|nr:ankyrin repeat domain-containing protein [Streptomyces nitrosporeus]QEU71374.1 ankyrin repeat domain-containing protein [Streptomyces nitrosporeus]GGY98374.1 hypothetical protein GCM10010327_31080 [Streptomyces nitrosporeus]